MKPSTSRKNARLTPPADRTATVPTEPPTVTIEIAVGPNPDGHADQIKSVHVAPDPADDTDAAEET